MHLEEEIEVSDGDFCSQRDSFSSLEGVVSRIKQIQKTWQEIKKEKTFVEKWDEDTHTKALIEASEVENDKSYKLRASVD